MIGDNLLMSEQVDVRLGAVEEAIEAFASGEIVEQLVRRTGEARIPTKHGEFTAIAFEAPGDGVEHVAFVYGDVRRADEVLVRVHSECLTGDLFGSLRCDCGPQFGEAQRRIAEAGAGVIVYLRGHEGRGIGLGHKLRAYELQDLGHDTVDANIELGLAVDSRDYGVGAQILADLGVAKVRLMTNNPSKFRGLERYDVEIVGREPLLIEPNAENIAYLRTKRERMGHELGDFGDSGEPTSDAGISSDAR